MFEVDLLPWGSETTKMYVSVSVSGVARACGEGERVAQLCTDLWNLPQAFKVVLQAESTRIPAVVIML